ncbi:MAG: prepilin-type N-terminal cleavage/methylation domain-containing protein [Rhodocyclaceae bacterium]|nr:MAG: prepilin-type N-terminal cleavage/methylation domain-containing protein [Rhodocyclaceae bacterium]
MPRKTTSGPVRIPGLFPFMGWRQRGFTQVELIVVIIMAGILGAVALPRWRGESGFEERRFRDELLSGLRYAQKMAIASRRTACASFSAAPPRAVFRLSSANGAVDCTTGAALDGPGGNALVVTATGNAGFATLPGDVVFDAGGRPGSGAIITFSGLDAALSITVEAETGHVH